MRRAGVRFVETARQYLAVIARRAVLRSRSVVGEVLSGGS